MKRGLFGANYWYMVGGGQKLYKTTSKFSVTLCSAGHAVQCSAVQRSAVLCSKVQCSAFKCSALQSSRSEMQEYYTSK